MSITTTGKISSLKLDKGFFFIAADGLSVYVSKRVLRESDYDQGTLVVGQETLFSYEEHEPGRYRATEIHRIDGAVVLEEVPEGDHVGTVVKYDQFKGFGFLKVDGFLDTYFAGEHYRDDLEKGARVRFRKIRYADRAHLLEVISSQEAA